MNKIERERERTALIEAMNKKLDIIMEALNVTKKSEEVKKVTKAKKPKS